MTTFQIYLIGGLVSVLTYILYHYTVTKNYLKEIEVYYTYYDIIMILINIIISIICSWASLAILIILLYYESLIQDKDGFIYKFYGQNPLYNNEEDESKLHWIHTILFTIKKKR